MALVNTWEIKIRNANKYYAQWENRFQCKTLESRWEGFHWNAGNVDPNMYKPYTVNLIMSEIKIKLANILNQKTEYELTPKPGQIGFDFEKAALSSQKKQDFLNTLIDNPAIEFNGNWKLFALDSFFRFGVMEVGYAADWRNPNKRPIVTDEDNKVINEDLEVPENERIFFRRIKASRFRVSVSDNPFLRNCSWAGYYGYIYNSVLKKTKGIKLPKDYDTDTLSSEFADSKLYRNASPASADANDLTEALKEGKVSIVWHIWDNERGKRLLILEPGFEIIWESDFERMPFVDFRHNYRLDGWYPVPPVYHWLSPQDEINEAREQMRAYRRRATRKFKYLNVEDDEIQKLTSDVDGEFIKVKPNHILEAIANPQVDGNIVSGLNASRDDFNTVVGASTDLNTVQRDRTTATQSKIIAAKAQTIENVEKIDFSECMALAGREALLTAGERFTQGIWAKFSKSPDQGFLAQMNPTPQFRMIGVEEIQDGYDFGVNINVVNATPAKMEEELAKLVKFLTLVSQFPQLSMDPTLIREAAFRCGYRNEAVIAAIQKTAMVNMLAQASAMGGNGIPGFANVLQGAMGGGGGQTQDQTAKQNMVDNAGSPEQEQIDTQLMGQG